MDIYTQQRSATRRRAEWAVVIFDIGDADKDTLPHTFFEQPCLDLYWAPTIGATYHYGDRSWQITKIDIPIEKKGSRKTKFVPVVTLKLVN